MIHFYDNLRLFEWKSPLNGSYIQCEDTKATWGKHRLSDDPWVIRIKLLDLAVTNFVRVPLYIVPFRIIGLMNGDIKRHAEKIAKRDWIVQEEYLAEKAQDLLKARTEKEIKKQLWSEVEKIVKFPLMLIGLFFAALIGIISPYDGRQLYSNIEDSYSRNKFDHYDNIFLAFNEYTAPCMQEDNNFFKKNIVKFNFIKGDANFLVYSNSHRLDKYKNIYQKHFGNIEEFKQSLFAKRKEGDNSYLEKMGELKVLLKTYIQNAIERKDQDDTIMQINRIRTSLEG